MAEIERKWLLTAIVAVVILALMSKCQAPEEPGVGDYNISLSFAGSPCDKTYQGVPLVSTLSRASGGYTLEVTVNESLWSPGIPVTFDYRAEDGTALTHRCRYRWVSTKYVWDTCPLQFPQMPRQYTDTTLPAPKLQSTTSLVNLYLLNMGLGWGRPIGTQEEPTQAFLVALVGGQESNPLEIFFIDEPSCDTPT